MEDCEGNCGKRIADCDGYWTVLGPRYLDGVDFCSAECMSSWLAAEVTG